MHTIKKNIQCNSIESISAGLVVLLDVIMTLVALTALIVIVTVCCNGVCVCVNISF